MKPTQHDQLETYFQQVRDIILIRQDWVTGLLPASTAVNVHGNYTDAWVRDNVYSILAAWGLALAYRRGEDRLCAEAVRLFVELYGAETGNLALKSLAVGGVFIGGGIGQKILPAMQDGKFIQAFKAKGRFFPLLDKIPVKLSLNPRTPLIGAINYFDR